MSFCKTKGVLDPVVELWAREGNTASQAWFDCVVGVGRKTVQEKCHNAFDSLRKAWNGEYASRLYNSEDYIGAAVSWLSHAVWKQSVEQALKSIPQQILEAGLDGTDAGSAINALSYVKPFEIDQYCDKGCAYVKKRHRETMLEVHPDRKPFPDAANVKEAEALAHTVSVAVNNAKETLCSPRR